MKYRIYRGVRSENNSALLAETSFFEDGEIILTRWYAGWIERIEDGATVFEKRQDG